MRAFIKTRVEEVEITLSVDELGKISQVLDHSREVGGTELAQQIDQIWQTACRMSRLEPWPPQDLF